MSKQLHVSRWSWIESCLRVGLKTCHRALSHILKTKRWWCTVRNLWTLSSRIQDKNKTRSILMHSGNTVRKSEWMHMSLLVKPFLDLHVTAAVPCTNNSQCQRLPCLPYTFACVPKVLQNVNVFVKFHPCFQVPPHKNWSMNVCKLPLHVWGKALLIMLWIA